MISKSQQNMAILDDEIKFLQNMDEMPKNLSLDKTNCDNSTSQSPQTGDYKDLVDQHELNEETKSKKLCENIVTKSNEFQSETRIELSFSVDRLLSDKLQQNIKYPRSAQHSEANVQNQRIGKCCDELNSSFSCCSLPNCLVNSTPSNLSCKSDSHQANDDDMTVASSAATLMDFKSIVRPTPVRAMGNSSESVSPLTPFSSLPPTSLIRFHHAQVQQQKPLQQHLPAQPNFTLSALIHPLCGLKPLQMGTPQVGLQNFAAAGTNRFHAKMNFDIPPVRPNLTCISTLRHHHLATANSKETHMNYSNNTTATAQANTASTNTNSGNAHGNVSGGKRKRSWSRAVFSNLQRKGLEIQFQQQKYITKPDRRKLAARLNLTDAQVKVWFQNRRMKWRHTRENLKSGQEKQPDENASADTLKASMDNSAGNELPGYSSEGSSSIEMSEVEEDDDEIDVVE